MQEENSINLTFLSWVSIKLTWQKYSCPKYFFGLFKVTTADQSHPLLRYTLCISLVNYKLASQMKYVEYKC